MTELERLKKEIRLNYKLDRKSTLGPRGPLRHKGVEVVSQLAHRRARRGSPPPPLAVARWGLEEGGGACLEGRMFQPKPDRLLSWLPSSVTRVEGVPKERVQSTEAEGEEYNSSSS